MYDLMSRDGVKYIIERIVKSANESMAERQSDLKDEYFAGKAQAYYEVLDIIKSELEIRQEDPKEYGLDVVLEKLYY